MENEKRKLSCKELVREQFNKTEADYIEAYNYFHSKESECPTFEDNNEEYDCYEDFFDYCNQTGLSWDFVERNTFEGQTRPYFRFQLSWGGPSDEFRIFVNADQSIDHIEYWYMDWFDGASINVPHDSTSFDVCSMFLDCEEQREPYDLIELEDSEEEDE